MFILYFFSARLSFQGSDGQDESSSEDLQKNLDRIRKLENDLINASKNKSIEEMKVLKNQQFWSKVENKQENYWKKWYTSYAGQSYSHMSKSSCRKWYMKWDTLWK